MADAASAEGELGLKECIDLALRNNPATRSARYGRLAAEANVGASRSAYYPSANATAEAGLSGNLGTSEPAMGPSGGSATGTSVGGGFSLSYLLFDGGARGARVDLAMAVADEAEMQVEVAALDVALEAEVAYYGLQGALWYLDAVEKIIRQSDSLRALAQARYEVGLARRLDMVQAEARLAEAELGRASAQRQVTESRGRLAKAVGLDVRTTLQVRTVAEGSEDTSLADIDWLIEMATARRPELRQAKSRVEQALAEVKLADAGHWPTVVANAGISSSWDSRGTGTSFPWSAGVGVTLPLFAGMDTTWQARRSRFDEKRACEELAGRVTEIQFEVWTARAEALEAAGTITAARKVVAAADEAVALAEESYKTGLSTMVEVFDAQGTRTSALLRLVQARVGWYVAFSRLERSVGAALAAGNSTGYFDAGPKVEAGR